MSQKLQVLSSI